MASLTNASWTTGLCGCCDDAGSCCLTFFCPCVAFGRIAEIVDQGATCLYSCCYCSRLRGQYALKEKPCADCCVHWFCEPCALCQEYRELKNRGYDMSIGMRTSR
ncbi:hypothetical protein ACQ4PT_052659 [Festuca glaucescens]